MISRLVFSSIRTNLSNFNKNAVSHDQKRGFRRLASTSSATASTKRSSSEITVTPGVNITPKRAPSAYNVFIAERTKELHQEKPGLKGSELVKQIAGKWKALSENDRRTYEEKSTRLQKEYEDAFLRMSSQEFRQAVEEEMARLQAKRFTALRRQQRTLKEAHHFPEPDAGYFKIQAAAKDHSKEISKNTSVPARGRKMGELWNNLSETEKKAYEKREQAARAKYRKDVESWEKKMEKDGLKSVVDIIKLRPQRKIAGTGAATTTRTRRRRKVLASKVATQKRGKARKTKRGRRKTAMEEEE